MNKKNAIILAISILFVGLLVTGGTYAYWSWNSNTNKTVVFNTSKDLQEYIIYDEGESAFVGEFQVSNTYTQGIHSTIAVSKTAEAANVDLVATIMMDINSIGPNMKTSPALKWVVTSGDSINVGSVLAKGNFVGTNDGDVLTLYPGIEVTQEVKKYTVWIWIDASENPSELLSGETLDTVVWTQIDQVEGVEDTLTITRISANNQNISATAVDSKYKITNYAVTTTNTTPTSWTTIPTADQSNIYTLNYTATSATTYYVWFKDANGKTASKEITVNTVDSTGPTCTFGSWNPTTIGNGQTSSIELTCTDSESQITTSNLTATDFTSSNTNITIKSVSKSTVTNGYKYTIGVEGATGNGTTTITLPAGKVKNSMNLSNSVKTSGSVTVDNTLPVCTISTPTAVAYGSTTTATVTCTDNHSINSQPLQISNFTTSNSSVATVNSVSDPIAVTNGYKYTVTLDAVGAGIYTLSIKADSLQDVVGNKNSVATSSNATINPYKCATPTGVAISTAGAVSWTNSATSACTTHQVKVANGSYANATSPVDKKSDIIAATGSRTVSVIAKAPNANYSDSDAASKSTTVYSVTLTKGTGISAVSGAGNYITGATVAIDATVATGYTWSKWTQTSGGTQVSTTKAYSAAISGNWAYTATTTVNALTFNAQTLTAGTYNVAYSKAFTGASNGSGNYTYAITGVTLDGNSVTASSGKYNGMSLSTTTISGTPTAKGTYVFTIKATDTTTGAEKSAAMTITINPYKCAAPTGVAISTAGAVSWTNSATSACTTHQVKVANGSYANATSPVDKKSDIIAATGSRTVSVIAKAPNANYSDSDAASKSTTVYSVTLTKGTGISAVSGAGNYITGATVAIDATVATGYTWSKWTQTSGGTQVSTTKAYSASISGNWAYTASATVSTYSITYKDCGDTTFSGTHDSGYPTSYTYGTGATLDTPSKANFTFLGYYSTSACSGTAVTNIGTSETGNKTFYAKWLEVDTITITKQTATYDGNVHSTLASSTSGLTPTITYYIDSTCTTKTTPDNSGVVAKDGGAPKDAGTYYVTATTAGNTNYSAGSLACTEALEILKKEISVTWGSTTSFTYNGSPQAPTASAATGISGETMTVVRTTKTNASTSNYTSTASCSSVSGGRAKCENYTLTNNTKTFTIGKATPVITLSATSGSVGVGSTRTFTATVKSGTSTTVSGTLNVTSGTTAKATVSPINTTITNANNSTGVVTTETITGVAVGSSTITVKFTPTDTTNFNSAANKTYTVTVKESNYLNVDTGVQYETLAEAFSEVQQYELIRALNSNGVETSNPTLAASQTGVKLDLNGQTVSLGAYYISNSGDLDIYSSVDGGILEGENTSSTGGVIYNNGTLTTNATDSINAITIRNISSDVGARVIVNTASKTVTLNENTNLTFSTVHTSTSSYRYLINTSGTLNINGATLTTGGPNTYNRGIYINGANGKVKVTSGSITSYGYTIYNGSGTGTGTTPAVSIEGGSVTSTNSYCIYNGNATGEISISGGTVQGTSSGVYNTSTGIVSVSGGTVTGTSTYGIYNKVGGTVNVTGGTVTGNNGLYNNAAGIINVSGGETQITGRSLIGIVGATGTITISGGTITGNTNGITATTGNVVITAGSISGKTHGVYISSTGSLTMGTNNENVIDEFPEINSTATTGSYYGVYKAVSGENGGTFNFYDGHITSTRGVGYTIYGDVDQLPVDYAVFKTFEDGVETASLVNIAYMYYHNTDKNTYYETLNEAFSDASSGNTIEVLNSKIEVGNATNALTNIKLNLNGHTIDMGTYSIINNGSLDIYNSSANDATIIGINNDREVGVIDNFGTLTTNGTNSTGQLSLINESTDMTLSIITNEIGSNLTLNSNTYMTFTNPFFDAPLDYYRYAIFSYGVVNFSGAEIVNNVNETCFDAGIALMHANARFIMTSGTIDTYGFAINNYNGTGSTDPAVVINGGTLISRLERIILSRYGKVLITDGILTEYGNEPAIDVRKGTIFEIGVNSGTPSITLPRIESFNSVAIQIENNSYNPQFNFYDGVIISHAGIGETISHPLNNNTANAVPSGYTVDKYLDGDAEVAILVQTGKKYYNVNKNAYYTTLNSAFSSASNGDTIQVMSNVTETANATNTKSNIKLDLNGYTVTMGTYSLINNGSLDIYNTKSTEGIFQGSNTTSRTTGVITNNGTLTTNGSYDGKPLTIRNTGTLYTGVVIANSEGADVSLYENTTITITGQFSVVPEENTYRYLIWNKGILDIYGANLTNSVNNRMQDGGICSGHVDARLTVHYGTISTYGLAINNYNGGSTTPPAVLIIDGSITSSHDVAISSRKGTVSIQGGTIQGTYGLYNYNSGIIIIGDDSTAVNSNSPQIIGTGTASSYAGVLYSDSSTVNFYDGLIRSSAGSGRSLYTGSSNSTLNTPIGYELDRSLSGSVETATLVPAGNSYYNVQKAASYDTLSSAFSNADAGNTIKLLKNKTESATATNNKSNIKLDLNGYTITMGTYYINNTGSLDIYSSSSSGGTIQGSNTNMSQGIIYNNGTLTTNATSSVNTINLKNTSNVYTAVVIYNLTNKTATLNANTNISFTTAIANSSNTNNRFLIRNDGILNIVGANLTNNVSTSEYECGVWIDTADGRVSMSSGNINVSGIGIDNTDGTGTTYPAVTISGGSIVSSNSNPLLTYRGNNNITGGTLISNTTFAIYVAGNGAVLNLGTSGGTPSITSPLIQSNTNNTAKNGVYVHPTAATFNYYDGKITSAAGLGHAINRDPDNIQTDYGVYKSVSNGVETAVLGRRRTFKFTNNHSGITMTSSNGNTYNSYLNVNGIENPATGKTTIVTPTISGKPNYFSSNANENGSFNNPSSGASVLYEGSSGTINSNEPTEYYVAATPITITFNRNGVSQIGGGTSNITKTCYYATGSSDRTCNITSPSITAGSGYTAVGWNTSSSATTSQWAASSVASVNASRTWYAIRKASSGGSTTSSVTLKANGGTWSTGGSANKTLTYTGTKLISTFPGISRNYYSLRGWTSSRTGSTYTYSIDSSDNGDTLSASWTYTGTTHACLCSIKADCNGWGAGATCVDGMCVGSDGVSCW